MVYRFISAENVFGKTIALRADLNSAVEGGNVIVSARIREHAQTIKNLSNKGAKVVVLSHQGQKGDDDFLSLKQHAVALEKLTGKKINFFTWEQDYLKEIKFSKNGDIILLENTRFNEGEAVEKTSEEHSKEDFVKNIAEVVDFFVLDALSVAHRSHASVVGFNVLVPARVGPVLEKEIRALEKLSNISQGKLLVLGGAKIEDSVKLLKHMLDKKMVDRVIIGGLFGELFLKAKGINFGKKEDFFVSKNFPQILPEAQKILELHSGKIVLPIDLALDENGKRKEISLEHLPSSFSSMDIGEKTAKLFADEISKAKLIVFNGPMGVYEKEGFEKGTKEVLEAIGNSKAFSILGGGDTETALDLLKLDKSKFGHVSLAGKALLSYLSGKELAGLKALQETDSDEC